EIPITLVPRSRFGIAFHEETGRSRDDFLFLLDQATNGKPHLCASWNTTIERCGLPGDLLRCGWGEQMTYEEMMQIEEAKIVAEQKAWERLHEVILKELFNETDKRVLAKELVVEQ